MKSLSGYIKNKYALLRKKVDYWYFTKTYSTNSVVERLKCSKTIRVVFIIQDLSAWKTELLFQAMLKDEHFSPFVAVVESMEENDIDNIVTYLKEKQYDFKVFDFNQNIGKELKADIIFYQKPYPLQTEVGNFAFFKYPKALYCYVNYAFHTVDEEWALNTPYLNYSWQIYFENKLCTEGPKRLMDNNGTNIVVTGLPFQDELLAKKNLEDPWKKQSKSKKRVIWAPHHTITDNEWITYSTFLDYCDDMLHLAEKYSDEIQFAFKPHPLLYPKLVKLWGQQKTDAYYQKWSELDNAQYCKGKYTALFEYSDAMIHDCGSFTVEYHYTQNPVLYLEKDSSHADSLNSFGREAYLLHYRAHGTDDVEKFLIDLIKGNDPMKEKRQVFYKENLLPPNGKTACDNIMSSIINDIYSKQEQMNLKQQQQFNISAIAPFYEGCGTQQK